jgi:hypothetical protein
MIAAADGTQVRVLRFASRGAPGAPPVLFVPGFLSFIESWELVLAELVARSEVLYFESREKRSSVVGRNPRFGIGELVGDLATVVRVLGLGADAFDVVASCGGVATVLRAHATLGLAPRRMVWIAPVVQPAVPWLVVPLSWTLRGPLYGVLQRVTVAWYRRFLNPPTHDAFQHSRFMQVVTEADPSKVARGARALHGLVVDAELARDVAAPVLVLAASHDLSHRFEDAVALARLLPGGRLEDLGDFWRTHAPVAGRAIADFLAAPDPVDGACAAPSREGAGTIGGDAVSAT